MAYYIWLGEEQCDDSTDRLEEALRIKAERVRDGYTETFITRTDDDFCRESPRTPLEGVFRTPGGR